MTNDHMTLEVADGVGLLTLNRPEEGNPVVHGMVQELIENAIRCDEDPAIRAMVLTGRGRFFSVGGGLKDFASQGDRVSAHLKLVTQLFHGAIAKFNRMAPPVIAAINGNRLRRNQAPDAVRCHRRPGNGAGTGIARHFRARRQPRRA